MYFPPTLQQQLDAPKLNVPFYRAPPPVPTFLPPDAQPEIAPSKIQASMAVPEEGVEEYKELLASLRLSEKIHVAGFTREARFITHCLAGSPDMPQPQLLTHQRSFVDQWGTSRRKLTLRSKDGHETGHEIPIPQYIGKSRSIGRHGSDRPRLKHIDNLIISTAPNAVIPTLLNIRDSINQDTTICLITPGLGLVEHLNDVIFPDPSTRPTFILGHSGHAITRDPSNQKDLYSMKVTNNGRLFLSGVPTEPSSVTAGARTEVDTWDRIVRRARTQHLLKLLFAAPGLNASGYPISLFLRHKLPSMAFSAVADTISVALGFRYERIYTDVHAQRLWTNLWNETIAIISALPELQQRPDILQYFRGHNFRTEMDRHLRAQTGASQWIALVRSGKALPLQTLNGWFVSRAEELGLSAVHHRTLMNMVRAKEKTRSEELKSDIPLYHSPYMLDSDCIRNEEEVSRPTVRVVYTNK